MMMKSGREIRCCRPGLGRWGQLAEVSRLASAYGDSSYQANCSAAKISQVTGPYSGAGRPISRRLGDPGYMTIYEADSYSDTLRGVRKHFKYRHAGISGTDKLENACKEGELGSGLSMRYSQMEMSRAMAGQERSPVKCGICSSVSHCWTQTLP
jgi:hypothetical protein